MVETVVVLEVTSDSAKTKNGASTRRRKEIRVLNCIFDGLI